MRAQTMIPPIYRIPETLEGELHELYQTVERFKARELSEAQFRAFRVPMGIYEQRESGTYMLRVRLPAGGILPHQLKRLAEVAAAYGNGVLHVTTRQDIQVHRVALDAMYPALLSLLEAGLSTKGGGGNTVRNITACHDSGVCPREAFDVAPYAVAVTERMLPDRLSYELPRKYKIAFSACSRDCAGATVNDLGFIAHRQAGAEGFAVYAGGGMGAKSRVGNLLHGFVPASDAFLVAEAVKRLFDKHGDRKNKHRARLRFLVERIGFEAFQRLYEEELAALRAAGPAPLTVRALPGGEPGRNWPASAPTPAPSAEFARWREANLTPQKQAGFFMVELPLVLGDLPAQKASALAEVVAAHGEGMLRATPTQNLVLRWASEEELPALHQELSALGLAEPQPLVLRNLVACAGASTCRLGICLSRGLAKALRQSLRASDSLDLDKLGGVQIHISGCPNACGRHPVAGIGFAGAARRVAGRLAPHYALYLGGRVTEGQTRLALATGTLPARNVPAFALAFLKAFQASRQAPDLQAFLDHGGRSVAEALVARYREVPAFEDDQSFYYDWDADLPFSLAGRGPGECSAGVFDLIEVDLASACEALNAGRHYAAAALAVRSLLITRGLQPKDDAEAFELFLTHFVRQGLVDRRVEPVVSAGARHALAADQAQTFAGAPADVAALVFAVRSLYDQMDASLRVKPPTAAPPGAAAGSAATDVP